MDGIVTKTHVRTTDELKENFDRLAKAWRRDTEFFSFYPDIAMDISYQQIIGLGPDVVPLILQELQKEPDHWFWALGAITQIDPAKDAPAGDIKAICNAWLEWGKQQGYIN